MITKEFMMPINELREKYKVGSTIEIEGKKLKVVKIVDAAPQTCFASFPQVIFEEER